MVLQGGEREKSTSVCYRSFILFFGAAFCSRAVWMPWSGWFCPC